MNFDTSFSGFGCWGLSIVLLESRPYASVGPFAECCAQHFLWENNQFGESSECGTKSALIVRF